MKLHPQISLAFNGQCKAAFRLYEKCFNSTISFMITWGKSPAAADAPPEWGEKIYHATLKIGDTAITGGDLPPGRYDKPKGFSVVLQMDDPAAADRIYHALSEHGTIQMSLQETFWAARFAAFDDQFGIPWTINCEKAEESTG